MFGINAQWKFQCNVALEETDIPLIIIGKFATLSLPNINPKERS
jgi:hypothetical protein